MAEALKIARRDTRAAQGVLSAQGGLLEASPRLRRFLAILADGRVMAVPAALSDPEFNAIKQRAAVAGMDLRAPTEATLDEIAAINANVENVKEFATQARQALLSILARAAKRRASDVLISRNEGTAEVRYRINGSMRTDRSLDPERAAALSNAAFNLCDSGDSLASTTRAARAAITNGRSLPHEVVGARLQYAPTASGFALLIRLSYASSAIRCRSLEEAGYSEHRAMAIRASLQSAAGVFLVAGPTEHGKSTTLNLAIEEFAKSFAQHPNIVAVEDPPERGPCPTFRPLPSTPQSKPRRRPSRMRCLQAFEWRPTASRSAKSVIRFQREPPTGQQAPVRSCSQRCTHPLPPTFPFVSSTSAWSAIARSTSSTSRGYRNALYRRSVHTAHAPLANRLATRNWRYWRNSIGTGSSWGTQDLPDQDAKPAILPDP